MTQRPGLPPRFKVALPARAAPIAADGRRMPERGSPASRGLDEKWTRMSVRFARQNPFCRMCDQEGRDAVLGDVRDHIKPRREYPQLTYVWSNIQNLCRQHDGLKARMEDLARRTGRLEELPFWCEALENRPAELMAIPAALWVRGT